MLAARERLRKLLAEAGCTTGASIFDPLSARIADMLGWAVCKLPGSTFKGANFALPDSAAIANTSDLVEVCAKICGVCDAPLIVDADDLGGTVLSVRRGVRDLERAGASGIEIEDVAVPKDMNQSGDRAALMHPAREQARNLKAAVEARRNPDIVVIARSRAVAWLPLEEALDRIRAYSDTGAEAIMLPETRNGRADIEAVAKATHLPLILLKAPADVFNDATFLKDARVRIRYTDQVAYTMAVKAIHDGLLHLKSGGAASDLADRRATAGLLEAVNRSEDFRTWQDRFAAERQ